MTLTSQPIASKGGLGAASRCRDVVEFFGEAFEAFVFAAEHDGKGVGGCRYQEGNVGQNVLRLALKQQVIAKRAEQNERQQQGFDGGSFADKQQINAGCKHDINDLHIEIEVQLQRLSQALVVDSLRQSSHLLRAERGGLELICLGFGRLMVLDLADPNALKGRFVPLAEDLLAEKVSRIIDLAERMQTRVDVLPRLFVGVVDGGVGVAGEFRRQIIIDVGVLGDGAVPAGRHVGLAFLP